MPSDFDFSEPSVDYNYRRRRTSWAMPIIVMGFVFLCGLGLACGVLAKIGGNGATSSSSAAPETITRVSAFDLFGAYEANEVNADRHYKGRMLEVTGAVDKIGKDLLGGMYVTLTSSFNQFAIMGVQCDFGSKGENDLARLQNGQNVTIRGRCDGKLGNVLLVDCVIVKPKPKHER